MSEQDKDLRKNNTSEDEMLWQEVVEDVTPLKARQREPEPSQEHVIQQRKRQAPVITAVTIPPGYVQYLEEGDMSRVDGAIAQKLKSGTYPLDATLDLHGRTQDEAFEDLKYFIKAAYSLGKRCILVITGKGIGGNGILHSQFPKWLNISGISEFVLAYNHAIQKHGGTGAFYVLLKKNRL